MEHLAGGRETCCSRLVFRSVRLQPDLGCADETQFARRRTRRVADCDRHRPRPAAEPRFSHRRERADVQQGRRADHVQQVRELPSPRRGRTNVAALLRRCAPVGRRHPSEGQHARHAAVARRSRARHVPQRSAAERPRDRHPGPLGRRWRARRRPRGAAAAAEVPRGMADRCAGCRVRDDTGLRDTGVGRDRLSVLRGSDQFQRRQVDAGW